MPKLSVDFPDGKTITFDGPANMSDVDAFDRALQERAVQDGRIQTTWFGGAAKAIGEDPVTTGALATGVGMLTGTAPLVAAAPLTARWLQYATQKFTGQKTDAPTLGDQAMLAAGGVASAYAPALIGRSSGVIANEIGKLPGKTLPQAAARAATKIATPVLDRAGMVAPAAVGGTVSEGLGQMADAMRRAVAGVSADDVKLMIEQVSKGMKPQTAAKIVAGKDPRKIPALLNFYVRSLRKP